MPIKPQQAVMTLAGSTLIVDSIKFSTEVQFFERMEFSRNRLRNAPEEDGSRPIFIQLPGGKMMQLQDGCVFSTPRDLRPDDGVYDQIYRRWDIKRWELGGGASTAANTDSVFAQAKLHKVLLDKYEALLAEAKADISITRLLQMQADWPVPPGFTFLTATGVSMAGMPLGSGTATTITNVLIIQFNPDVDYEEPTAANYSTSRVLRRWSAIVEQRTETHALSNTY